MNLTFNSVCKFGESNAVILFDGNKVKNLESRSLNKWHLDGRKYRYPIREVTQGIDVSYILKKMSVGRLFTTHGLFQVSA